MAKVSFTEQDAAAIVAKYETATVLTVLQEVSSFPRSKINWKELVENSKSGISSAREYQMLWRHLAYGHPLLDQDLDHDDDQPLDDDSDIEFEREAVPRVTEDTALEAEAYVKLMVESQERSQLPRTSSVISAPLFIAVPGSGSSSRNPNGFYSQLLPSSSSMEDKRVIFPVTVQRPTRPPPSSRAEKPSTSSTTASSSTFTEKKRKPSFDEEARN